MFHRNGEQNGTGAGRFGRLLPLLGAMLWTFLLVLTWETAGPREIGLALYAAAAVASAVVYLWPGVLHRLLGWVFGGSWDGDG